jgi:hypothetical protein
MFVIAGGFTPGVILSSPDGLDWTERHTVDMHFAGLTFGNGTFVAVGYNRRIWSSPDGVAWIQRDGGPAVTALSDITFGQGTFLAVGADGTIIQSLAIPYPTPVVLSLTVTPEGAQLRFTGDAGRTYRLQRASNPAGPWTTFATLTAPPKGAVDHLDPAPLSSPTFYRVAAPWPPCSAGIEIGYCFHCFGGASGTY